MKTTSINKTTWIGRSVNYFTGIIMSAVLVSCMGNTNKITETRIAFGSCGHEDTPQPMLIIASEQNPDAFIYLGDNIYGDTQEMDTLRAKYAKLGTKPEFIQLQETTRILATWDDHDFGQNDAGKHYTHKEESKEIFLNFFQEPANSERRRHPGIYTSEFIRTGDIRSGGKSIQVILLDNRTFRSDLLTYDGNNPRPRTSFFYSPDYSPHHSTDSTLLGEAQWQWLEKELEKPADLRLICSGTQFGIEFNGYEAWANFPHEQQRMISLIKSTKAEGVIFLSGDVHYAEISKLQSEGVYPIYDITASGITSTWDFATPNANRVEGPVMENHIGLLTIRWEKDPIVRMEIIDKNKNSRIEFTVKSSDLRFANQEIHPPH